MLSFVTDMLRIYVINILEDTIILKTIFLLQEAVDTSPGNARFTSNLFGSFGAGLFSPPNTIDFGSVFDDIGGKLVENMPVVATVILVLIAYIPVAIFCRRQDKKDKFKVK